MEPWMEELLYTSQLERDIADRMAERRLPVCECCENEITDPKLVCICGHTYCLDCIDEKTEFNMEATL